MLEDESDFDIEVEKVKRRKKLEQKRGGDDADDYNKRPGRLSPFDKGSRRFNWKEELEDDNDD